MRLVLIILLAVSCCRPAVGGTKVIAVPIDGMVHPITVEILGHASDQARQQGAALILLRINTPGGLVDATRQIVEKVVSAPAPVVSYVTPSGGRAASAGFFLLQAGDVAAMAPGTNTGAASPVLLGGQMDPTMKAKVESDAAASLRSLVAKRGRNVELAEKTVLEAKSFTEKEALDNRLIEIIANDEADLLRQLNGREVTRFDGRKQKLELDSPEIIEYQKTVRERLITAIADPNIAFVLLILGGLGIYVEFSSPGLIVPGVVGSILVLLGLSALSVLPINLAAVALLILAVALFILEAKFASHGILGAGGAVAMVLGAVMLVEGPPEMRIRWSTAVAVTLPFAIITIFLVSLVIKARANKVVTGETGMQGLVGVVHTPLEPEGKVFVRGEIWDAEAAEPIPAGAKVRVVEMDGLKLKVERC